MLAGFLTVWQSTLPLTLRLTARSGRTQVKSWRLLEARTMEALATLGIVVGGIAVAVGLSYASMQAVLSLMPTTHRSKQK